MSDRIEIMSFVFSKFVSQYMDLEMKKQQYIQKIFDSEVTVNICHQQIMESCSKMNQQLEIWQNLISNQELLPKTMRQREVWSVDRKSTFWEQEVPIYSDEKFKKHFRMTRESFTKLCHKLYFLKKENTRIRSAIPLEKRIGIAVYALGSSSEYGSVANLFGIGRTTTGEIVLKFCAAVCDVFESEFNNGSLSEEIINEIVTGVKGLDFSQKALEPIKARFRKIGKELEVYPENVSIIIRACCILHNFLNQENDKVWTSWMRKTELATTEE